MVTSSSELCDSYSFKQIICHIHLHTSLTDMSKIPDFPIVTKFSLKAETDILADLHQNLSVFDVECLKHIKDIGNASSKQPHPK